VEPAARNTGPAMVYCCDLLRAYDAQAHVVFLPADSFIPTTDYDQFRLSLQHAIDFSRAQDTLVLCGIKPTHAATGYGYIEHAQSSHTSEYLFEINRFHEKPTVAVAQYYLQMPNMLWNSGIVVCSVALFMRLCTQQAPDLVRAVERYVQGTDSYAAVPAISIDYALLEHVDNIWIMPMNITWFDVGNLGVLLALQQSQQSADTVLSINASDNLVYTQGKLVVLIGIEQVCVVDMPDVLLITKKESAESVKMAVNSLKQQGLNQYL
jgi:mannose-1-phosphate guanylyltransferase